MERKIWESAEMTDGQIGLTILIVAMILIIRIMDKNEG